MFEKYHTRVRNIVHLEKSKLKKPTCDEEDDVEQSIRGLFESEDVQEMSEIIKKDAQFPKTVRKKLSKFVKPFSWVIGHFSAHREKEDEKVEALFDNGEMFPKYMIILAIVIAPIWISVFLLLAPIIVVGSGVLSAVLSCVFKFKI